ncbi:MAG TPA: ChaN family lipoprotein [Kofleriaceae bacterium]|nr:ChaN family lipoprotein [Kofleriaceae bacterium]
MARPANVVAVVAAVAMVGCAHARAPGPAAPAPASGDDLTAAALPYAVLEARGGREVEPAAFFAALSGAAAVCLGEKHPSPHHHWAQREILDHLAAAGHRPMALGLEMVQRPFQGVLDDYTAGRITEAEFLARSGWHERWGFDFGLYRPILALATDRGLAVIALNAERDLVHAVSTEGLDGLSAAQRAQLPELDLKDAAHRAWFAALMADMGGAGCHAAGDGPHGDCDPDSPEARAQADRFYTAQVVWDETMAESAARWLAAHPGGQMVILAGNGHCVTGAIPRRLERRQKGQVISVRIVVDTGDGEIAAHLADPHNDYLWVMRAAPPPPHDHPAPRQPAQPDDGP